VNRNNAARSQFGANWKQAAPDATDDVVIIGAADKPLTFTEIVLAFDLEMRRHGEWENAFRRR
jgi:hypothetical protein